MFKTEPGKKYFFKKIFLKLNLEKNIFKTELGKKKFF